MSQGQRVELAFGSLPQAAIDRHVQTVLHLFTDDLRDNLDDEMALWLEINGRSTLTYLISYLEIPEMQVMVLSEVGTLGNDEVLYFALYRGGSDDSWEGLSQGIWMLQPADTNIIRRQTAAAMSELYALLLAELA